MRKPPDMRIGQNNNIKGHNNNIWFFLKKCNSFLFESVSTLFSYLSAKASRDTFISAIAAISSLNSVDEDSITWVMELCSATIKVECQFSKISSTSKSFNWVQFIFNCLKRVNPAAVCLQKLLDLLFYFVTTSIRIFPVSKEWTFTAGHFGRETWQKDMIYFVCLQVHLLKWIINTLA